MDVAARRKLWTTRKHTKLGYQIHILMTTQKKELESIAGDENEIKERFYADLEFGTAGLRGIIGAGTNRMNVYTVRKATQGLANYIIKQNGQKKGVAIAF